jgi:hypothetical protein
MKLFLVSILITFNVFANSSDYTPYVLKKGDTVSDILKVNKLAPLYGDKQWVEKVLKLNRLTEKSAKKMEPGDAILLPKASFYYSDDIKTMQSSWQKKMEADYKAPKHYNFTLIGGYFYQDVWFDKADSVSLDQNFFMNARYKEREPISFDSVTYNPNVEVGVYTQSNANFENNTNRVAEFTPSAFIKLGYEAEFRNTQLALNPNISYESFSTLYFNGVDYDVDRRDILWSGLELKKTFSTNDWSSFFTAFASIGNSLDAQRVGAKAGVDFLNHYQFEVTFTQDTMTIDTELENSQLATAFGYRF